MKNLTKLLGQIMLVCLMLVSSSAWAWWVGGHSVLVRAAVRSLPTEMPEFFRQGEDAIAHYVYDPDLAKNRATKYLRKAEHSEHYLDLEFLEGRQLPKSRYEFIALCQEVGVKPEKVGFVPYSIGEWAQRLTIALAEHRRWPNNTFIQQKCLLYAGFLAHYAQDQSQPLHTTIHFDGRAKSDGKSPHSGIHEKIDSIIEYMELQVLDLAKGQEINAFEGDVMDAVLDHFNSSHKMVDTVYELEKELPEKGQELEAWKVSKPVAKFVNERTRAAVQFTAQLYLTTWQQSKSVKFEGWFDRSSSDQTDE